MEGHLNKSPYIHTMECYVITKRNETAQYVPIVKGLQYILCVESKKQNIVHGMLVYMKKKYYMYVCICLYMCINYLLNNMQETGSNFCLFRRKTHHSQVYFISLKENRDIEDPL